MFLEGVFWLKHQRAHYGAGRRGVGLPVSYRGSNMAALVSVIWDEGCDEEVATCRIVAVT